MQIIKIGVLFKDYIFSVVISIFYLGLVFLLLVIYQHLDGIFTWHKEIKNSTHRKIGTRIVIFGRVLAGLGWLIVEENKYYAIVVLIISVSIYAFVEKNTWKKIKIV